MYRSAASRKTQQSCSISYSSRYLRKALFKNFQDGAPMLLWGPWVGPLACGYGLWGDKSSRPTHDEYHPGLAQCGKFAQKQAPTERRNILKHDGNIARFPYLILTISHTCGNDVTLSDTYNKTYNRVHCREASEDPTSRWIPMATMATSWVIGPMRPLRLMGPTRSLFARCIVANERRLDVCRATKKSCRYRRDHVICPST